jgi:hypothetical protein
MMGLMLLTLLALACFLDVHAAGLPASAVSLSGDAHINSRLAERNIAKWHICRMQLLRSMASKVFAELPAVFRRFREMQSVLQRPLPFVQCPVWR